MKKTLLCMVMCISVWMHAQNYTLSFTASGAATTVDSIKVINLTQCLSLSLLGSDQLNLLPNAGIADAQAGAGVAVYPNPFTKEFRVDFATTGNENATLTIYDITGKTIISSTAKPSPGAGTFTVSGLKTGVYLMCLQNGTSVYNTQLVSLENPLQEVRVVYSIGNTDMVPIKKSKAVIPMAFDPGDRLLFKGYSGNYARVLTLVPTSSQTVNFSFIACTDGDAYHYAVVTIGTQTWMAENIKTTTYNDGTAIPLVTDNASWAALTTPAYCWYDNAPVANASVYGALYNWYVLDAATNGGKNICPAGWRVATGADWGTLYNFLGGMSVTGGLLKENCASLWTTPNTAATNEAGFSALPGGGRYYSTSGAFYGLHTNSTFWTATAFSSTQGSTLSIENNSAYIYTSGQDKANGFSVRCVKE